MIVAALAAASAEISGAWHKRLYNKMILSLWRWRSLRFFLSALARFHFDVGRGHCVGDMNFIANFDVTCDFGVRVAVNLPTVFPLLHHDHRIIHF